MHIVKLFTNLSKINKMMKFVEWGRYVLFEPFVRGELHVSLNYIGIYMLCLKSMYNKYFLVAYAMQ